MQGLRKWAKHDAAASNIHVHRVVVRADGLLAHRSDGPMAIGREFGPGHALLDKNGKELPFGIFCPLPQRPEGTPMPPSIASIAACLMLGVVVSADVDPCPISVRTAIHVAASMLTSCGDAVSRWGKVCC